MRLDPLIDDQHAVVISKTSVSPTPDTPEYFQSARQILTAIGVTLTGEKIVIKPNVTIGERFADPDSGITTHPHFVHGLVAHLKDCGAGSVYILEDPRNDDSNDSRDWAGTGYQEVAEATGAKLRCPVAYTCVRKVVPEAHVHTTLNVSRLAVDPDVVLINVPKLKTHNLATTTLCMKNLMGVVNGVDRHYCRQAWDDIPDECRSMEPGELHERWQRGLAGRLVDTAKVVRPRLNIIEGVVGRDGTGFRQGRNHHLGLAVAGINMVAVDSVASYLMGFDPKSIIYLTMAAEAGLGVNDVGALKLYTVEDGKLERCRDLEALRVEPKFELITRLPEVFAL